MKSQKGTYFPWVVAHRGAMRAAPENTRSAFEAALKYNINGIECDLQLTKDGVIVLYHDKTLTKINNTRKRISDVRYESLYNTDWGTWYSCTFKGEHILTLEEVLEYYLSKTALMLEIKSRKRDRQSGRSLVLARKVLNMLDRKVSSKDRRNIFVLSFDMELLKYSFETAPCWQYVLDLYDPPSDIKKIKTYPGWLYGICVPVKNLNEEFAEAVRKNGQFIMTYSCNTTQQVQKAIAARTDVIMTDRPGWLSEKFKNDIIR